MSCNYTITKNPAIFCPKILHSTKSARLPTPFAHPAKTLMKSILTGLLLFTIFASVAQAQTQLPESIVVGTDVLTPSEFSPWTESDLTKYDGTYAGEVGGDTNGSLTIKIKPATGENDLTVASGTFERTTVSLAPTVVKFTEAYYFTDSEGTFDVGAFNVSFVKLGETPGVIVGNLFLPKK